MGEPYQKVYARHEGDNEAYGLKSYWTSSQTAEFSDGTTLQEYKETLDSELASKADKIGYDVDEGKVYLYSGNTQIEAEDMGVRMAPNVELNDIEHLGIRLSGDSARITWEDPDDVVFGDLTLVEWDGTKVIRKAGSAPTSPSDGAVVVDNKVSNQYATTPLYDNIQGGNVYYYRFYPYDTDGNYYGKTCGAIYKPITLVGVDVPTVNGTYTYTGSAQTVSLSGYDNTKMTMSGDSTATNVGTYTITFSLESGYKWSDDTTEDKSITWSIGVAEVAQPTVTGSFTYDGTSKSPSVSGFNGSIMTKSGDQSATNAGSYTLVISLSDTTNYKFAGTNETSLSYNWNIGRATLSVPTAGSLTYNGSEQSPTWTGYDNTKMTIGGVTVGTNAGSYTASFTPGNNYEWTDNTTVAKNVEWSIGKANGTLTLSKNSMEFSSMGQTDVSIASNYTGTLSASSEDISIATVSVSGSVVTVSCVNNGEIRITVTTSGDDNHYATSASIVVYVDIKRAVTNTLYLTSPIEHTSTWTPTSFTVVGSSGAASASQERIWNDGYDAYYTFGSLDAILDKENRTFTANNIGGGIDCNAKYIWSDGENTYYSYGGTNKIFNKAAYAWEDKVWNGITNINGSCIWRDGDNIYYSYSSNLYELDKDTSTWNKVTTWKSPGNGEYIWTCGNNVYYSGGSTQKKLNKDTLTWENKTWNNFSSFFKSFIWSDGNNIYYSNNGYNFVLNKDTEQWENVTWNGLTKINGVNIWTDGDHIYHLTNYILA